MTFERKNPADAQDGRLSESGINESPAGRRERAALNFVEAWADWLVASGSGADARGEDADHHPDHHDSHRHETATEFHETLDHRAHTNGETREPAADHDVALAHDAFDHGHLEPRRAAVHSHETTKD